MKRFLAGILALLVIAFTVYGCSTQPYGQKWITLLDATSLDHWNRIGDANWRVTDGVVVADRGGKASSYLVSKNSYADFELRAEFWGDADANSGIFIRCTDPQKFSSTTAYEAQINDKRADGYGTGAITLVSKVSPMLKTDGQWNVYEIKAQGTQLTVVLNGKVTAHATDSQFASGPIALQYVAGIVKFRKVEIRLL